MTDSQKLSPSDVSRLLANPSADMRAETAAKIADQFDQGLFTQSERKLAEEIFRLMVKDAEVRVRQALSTHLRECPTVPHDVALSLAKDVDQVALPMLEVSQVLTDSDLIEIVRSQSATKQVAVARRPKVSDSVADALVDTKNETVVATLVANEGADISENTLEKVVQGFEKSEAVHMRLVNRARLPIAISEKLVTIVSEKLRATLMAKRDLPDGMTADLIIQARERAVLGLSSETDQEADVEALVAQLNRNGRLTPSIVLRAVCMGDLRFFEASLSELAKVPLVNTRILIYDSGQLGFKGLYDQAGLPKAFFAAMRAAVDVAKEIQFDGEPHDRERYSRRMIERILTQYGDLGVDFQADDLEYLLTKMNQLPPAMHTE